MDRNYRIEQNLFRDVSLLPNERLEEEIIAQARIESVSELQAGLTLPETAEITEYHARIQRIQDTEPFDAGSVADHILLGASELYSQPDLPLQTFKSLDDLITKKGAAVVRTDTLNAYRLTKPEQVLFLRAVYMATAAREYQAVTSGRRISERQLQIQRRALFSLRHMATNSVKIPETVDEASARRFAGAYAANYLSRSVLKELHVQGQSTFSSSSVDEALRQPIAFGQLVSGEQPVVVSAFPPGERVQTDGGNLGFEPVYPAEIDSERITRLRGMQWSFGGPHTEFRYYESIKPFGIKAADRPGGEGSGTAPGGEGDGSKPGGSDEDDKEDDAEKQDYNYLILEVRHPDESGTMKTHVAADCAVKGNACFALREEVLDEWERLLGIRMTWRDVFTQPRGTARQMGARRIVHAKGCDVAGRVKNYLLQDAESMVLETFGAIFDRNAGLFDDEMRPTEKNRMPAILLKTIRSSAVLAERWSAIRQFGYASTARNEAAVERAVAEAPSPRERRVSLAERAREIFARIVAEEE